MNKEKNDLQKEEKDDFPKGLVLYLLMFFFVLLSTAMYLYFNVL